MKTHDVECTMEDKKNCKIWVFRELSGTVTIFLGWKAEELMLMLTLALALCALGKVTFPQAFIPSSLTLYSFILKNFRPSEKYNSYRSL